MKKLLDVIVSMDCFSNSRLFPPPALLWLPCLQHIQYFTLYHHTNTFCYSPTQRMLKQKPCVTDLLTSWSGRLSNPTWPPKLRLRFSSFWQTRDKTLDIWCMSGGKHMVNILTDSKKTRSLFYTTSKTFCSVCRCKNHQLCVPRFS